MQIVRVFLTVFDCGVQHFIVFWWCFEWLTMQDKFYLRFCKSCFNWWVSKCWTFIPAVLVFHVYLPKSSPCGWLVTISVYCILYTSDPPRVCLPLQLTCQF